MNYWAIVHHDEGSAFGVSFPDVPDCITASDDEAGVMAAAIDALDDYYADVKTLPTPMDLTQVRDTYSEDLAEGAYLVQVPLIVRTHKSVRVNLSMDRGLLDAIDEAAARAGLHRSAFLAQAASREILGRGHELSD